MANSSIQLGRMDFDDIRTNIKEFMETQSSELDFNFDGSIAATVLDLLAYNTMYYAFYSNMLINESFLDSAQRIESLISLVKPFGFTISHRQGASVEATIKNITTSTNVITISPYSDVISGNLNGLNYTFYYTGNETNINPGASTNLTFYQGKSASNKQPVSLNYEKQQVLLDDKSVDTRTLRVYVRENGSSGTVEYTRVKNTDSSISAISKVYYLETTNTGYKILFGGYSNTDGSQLGRGVGSTESVFVSYVSSSGSAGNNVTNFSIPRNLTEITNNPRAVGGFDSPNLDTIKFLAPRQFSSQGSLVSVSDYEKEIKEISTDLQVNENNPRNNISVYGGAEASDGVSGFVYFSLYGEDGGIGNSAKVLNNLKDSIPVGLSLQHKTPTNAKITFSLDTLEGRVTFNDLYFRGGPPPGTKGFNQTVKSSEVGSWSKVDVEVTPFNNATNFGTQTKFDLKNKLVTSNFSTSGCSLSVRGTVADSSSFVATTNDGSAIRIDGSGTQVGTVSGTKLDFSSYTDNFNTITGISANYDVTDSTVASKIVVEHELLGELAS